MTDMRQHRRTLENGIRIGPTERDAMHVAPSGISGHVTFVVESMDGGVTLSREQAEQVVAAIQKALK